MVVIHTERGPHMARSTLRIILSALVALQFTLVAADSAKADSADPYLGTWYWPDNYQSTYKYDSTIPESWFRSQVNSGFNGMNNTSASNPRFVYSSTSTKGLVRRISNSTSCVGA